MDLPDLWDEINLPNNTK